MSECTKTNGNCTKPSDDQQAVQCVGRWAKQKHDYLHRYIDATRSARKKFVVGPGGAAFIDLFAGPGRARIRDTGEFIPGSPIIALEHSTPFTKAILCDLDPENVRALRARTAAYGEKVHILEGDCNDTIDEIVELTSEYGLNLALIDPFGVRPLSFDTITKLASVRRMDLLFHFPTSAIKRNLSDARYHPHLDRFLGTTEWRRSVTSAADVGKLLELFRARLAPLGYKEAISNAMPVTNGQNNILYHLVLFSKHRLGHSIWQSVTNTNAKGQTSLKFK